jgi:hypothetical protein
VKRDKLRLSLPSPKLLLNSFDRRTPAFRPEVIGIRTPDGRITIGGITVIAKVGSFGDENGVRIEPNPEVERLGGTSVDQLANWGKEAEGLEDGRGESGKSGEIFGRWRTVGRESGDLVEYEVLILLDEMICVSFASSNKDCCRSEKEISTYGVFGE